MDKSIYTAATSGKHTLSQMDTLTHNLANVSSDGFRAQMNSFRAVPVITTDLPSQTYVVDSTIGVDFTPGPIRETGRALDVAIRGKGWLVVQAPDGKEAYVRAGSLQTDENGVLQTQRGLSVLSSAGPITLPPDETITISGDGTVSSIPIGNKVANVSIIDQLKLVNPPEDTLVRGDDGLFRTKNGQPVEADPTVTVQSGYIEASNVNAVESMVGMIELARAFDIHMQMLSNIQSNDVKASTVMTMS